MPTQPRLGRRDRPAKAQIARSPATYGALRALSFAMRLDLLLFGRITSGPFFALLEKGGSSGLKAPGLRQKLSCLN